MFIYVSPLKIKLTRRECWVPVNKTGVLGSSQQDGSVGIQSTIRECWDPLTRRECWDPINKTGVLGSSQQDGSVGTPFSELTSPHCCACHKPGSLFATSHLVVILCSVSSVKMRGDCSFGEIDDHLCLNFLFIMFHLLWSKSPPFLVHYWSTISLLV